VGPPSGGATVNNCVVGINGLSKDDLGYLDRGRTKTRKA